MFECLYVIYVCVVCCCGVCVSLSVYMFKCIGCVFECMCSVICVCVCVRILGFGVSVYGV